MARSKSQSVSGPPLAPVGFFVLRTPLLPFDELLHWSEGLRAPSIGQHGDLPAALAADGQLLRERLRAIVSRPEVREALLVASPSLCESLPKWLALPESKQGQKVEQGLVRCFARLAAQSTPRGLLAGGSVGLLGPRTLLELGSRQEYRRHTRLDGDYLASLAEALAQLPDIRDTLVLQPNPSLSRLGGRIHYIKSRMKERSRLIQLATAESSDELEATLARASSGARLGQLAEALVGEEVDLGEARAYVNDLVDSQILVSALAPQLTGPEPIHDLIAQLASHVLTEPVAARLCAAQGTLQALDASPLGAAPATYAAIRSDLQALPGQAHPRRLFQVDLIEPASRARLGPKPVAEILRGAKLLGQLSSFVRGPQPLARFVQAWNRRYQGRREVPLLEALDEQIGIGFDREGVPSGGARTPLEVPWGEYQTLLLRKLQAALVSGAQEIDLEEDELGALEPCDRRPLPDSLAALVTIAAASPEALDAGDFSIYLKMVDGPSAANRLGRFCHCDPRLAELVRDCLRAEEAQRPEAIFAEIVQVPQGREANVFPRPALRDHEIVLLGRSGAAAERQIPVDDLLLSVEASRIILRSRRLGREVLPRLGTTHSFPDSSDLGLYRFLCHLQTQDSSGSNLSFSWGGALDQSMFLPRVRSGRLVLSLARWRLGAEERERLGRSRGAARYEEMQKIRTDRNLPRWVTVGDGHRQLAVDLDNVLSVETCVALIRRRPEAGFSELFGLDKLAARGPEGRFLHELLLPLAAHRKRPPGAAAVNRQRAAPPRPAPAKVRRLCPPGSEWLYAKIYCGSATADRLLAEVVPPLIAGARASGAADFWFFSRHGDPDWHLRLRFHGHPDRLRSEVLPPLAASAQDCLTGDRVWKFQLDTYEREIDRYGGEEGMLLAERLFAADSEACLAILQAIAGDEEARWRLTLRGMDMLLDDLGFDLSQKLSIVRACRQAFSRGFHAVGPLQRPLGVKFRRERPRLEALLDPRRDDGSPFEPGLEVLRRRSRSIRRVAAELREKAATGLLTIPLETLAGRYLHLHANRMLRDAPSLQELVLYDFLNRLYRSQTARWAQGSRL
jgi:lantibiotic biosynthesis protein